MQEIVGFLHKIKVEETTLNLLGWNITNTKIELKSGDKGGW
jgi:hypothetical protein